MCGGVVLFVGRVRPDRRGKGRVVALEYEADLRMAGPALLALEREARRRFAVRRVVLAHRVGRLAVGTPSVLVGVAAPHRRSAFGAARFLIDRLKRDVPIWKTERTRAAPRRRRGPNAPG
jgi:molybdopterin synthase catalytic subunit